jgi:rRNA-processing protein FCF1
MPVILGIPCVTDCVVAEIEKLGIKYRLALKYVHLKIDFFIGQICSHLSLEVEFGPTSSVI